VLTVDITPPTVTVFNAALLTNDPNYNFDVSLADNFNIVDYLDVYLNGAFERRVDVQQLNFNQQVYLTQAANTIRMVAYDRAGNPSTDEVITVTLDQTDPEPLIWVEDLVQDQNQFHYTTSNSVTLQGSVDEQSTITVLNYNPSTDTTTSTAVGSRNGQFSYAYNQLNMGVNVISYQAVDQSSNSRRSRNITIIMDPITPVCSIVSPMSGDIIGNRDVQLSVQCTAEYAPFNTTAVNLTINGQQQSTFQFTEQGIFSGTGAMQPGINNIEVCAANILGSAGCTPAWSITVDEDVPRFSQLDEPRVLSGYGLHFTDNETPTIRFSFLDSVELTSVTMNGGADISAQFTDSNFYTTFTYHPTQQMSGTNTIEIRATKMGFGQSEAVIRRNFSIDTTPPSLSIDTPPSQVTNEQIFTIFGECSDDYYVDRIEVWLNGYLLSDNVGCQGGDFQQTGFYSYDSTLYNRNNDFIVRAYDELGHSIQRSISVIYDIEQPEAMLHLPALNLHQGIYYTNEQELTLTGEVSESSTIIISHGSNTTLGQRDGTFNFTRNLNGGMNTIFFYARDTANNLITSNQIRVVYDPSAPTCTNPQPTLSGQSWVDISVECDDDWGMDEAEFLLQLNGDVQPFGYYNQQGFNIYRYDNLLMNNGQNTVQLAGADLAGNTVSIQWDVNVDIDTPQYLGMNSPSRYTNDQTPTFQIQYAEEVNLERFDISGVGEFSSSFTSSDDMLFTYTPASNIAEGVYTLNIEATKRDFGIQAAYNQETLTVDITPPTVTVFNVQCIDTFSDI
jgi:hypothetical protein